MPTDMSKYPANWSEIRNRILRRAGGNEDDPRVGARCEKCGIRNYDVGALHHNSYSDAKRESNYNRLNDLPSSIVVLTIAHIHDPDPQNVADDNLQALCNRCHLRLDRELHKSNSAKTRYAKKLDAGQIELISLW